MAPMTPATPKLLRASVVTPPLALLPVEGVGVDEVLVELSRWGVNFLVLMQRRKGLPSRSTGRVCRISRSGVGGGGATSAGRGTAVAGTTSEAGTVGAGPDGNNVREGGRTSAILKDDSATGGRG